MKYEPMFIRFANLAEARIWAIWCAAVLGLERYGSENIRPAKGVGAVWQYDHPTRGIQLFTRVYKGDRLYSITERLGLPMFTKRQVRRYWGEIPANSEDEQPLQKIDLKLTERLRRLRRK